MSSAECSVQIEFSQVSGIGDDAEDHLRRISGKILGRAAVGDRDFDMPIGSLELVYVDVGGAMDRGIPLYDFFDYEAVVDDYCPMLYDLQTGEFSHTVRRVLGDDVFQWNTLILHRLKTTQGTGKLSQAYGQLQVSRVLATVSDWSRMDLRSMRAAEYRARLGSTLESRVRCLGCET